MVTLGVKEIKCLQISLVQSNKDHSFRYQLNFFNLPEKYQW